MATDGRRDNVDFVAAPLQFFFERPDRRYDAANKRLVVLDEQTNSQTFFH